MHIAIVDDDKSVCQAMARLLAAHSFLARSYVSAREFLKSLEVETPDCLILDLRMDDMTGLDLLYHLVVRGSGIPAIVVTAHDDPGARLLCESVGTAAFLLKPVACDSLLKSIGSATGASRVTADGKAELIVPRAGADRGTVTEISKLPAYERIMCYRALAKEIRAEAPTMESSTGKPYFLIAEQWEKLAMEVEKRFIN